MYKIKVRKNPCPGRGSHADFLQGLTEAKVEKLKVSARGGPTDAGASKHKFSSADMLLKEVAQKLLVSAASYQGNKVIQLRFYLRAV